jgi:hypothetical protein
MPRKTSLAARESAVTMLERVTGFEPVWTALQAGA